MLVTLLVAFAIFGPLLSPHGPLASDFSRGVNADQYPVGPGATFLFGADRLFRDEFVRLAYGARLSLLIAVAATVISTVVGGVIGVLAGYHEGREGALLPWPAVATFLAGLGLWASSAVGAGVSIALMLLSIVLVPLAPRLARLRAGPRVNLDTALMRVVDVLLAFPFLVLVMAIGAALDRTTPLTLILVLGLVGWLGTARIIRAKTLTLRNLDFVAAARALGQPAHRILWLHVVPNLMGPLIVIGTTSIAALIVAESTLSYLGVGVSPPMPTWGQMLLEGQEFYAIAPWTLVAPGLSILMAVLGFNLLGEGLRDALDPKD